MMRRFDANRVASFCVLAAGFGARDSLSRRANRLFPARWNPSCVPTSQAHRLAPVRVMRATRATCRRGCACRRRAHTGTTLFSWDIGTVGRNGGVE